MTQEKGLIQNLTISTFSLYGEDGSFPDVLHCEKLEERAVKHDWKISPHRHVDLHQFFLFHHGKGEVNIDGHSLELTPPSVISIPARSVHSFRFSRGTSGYVLTLPVSELTQAFEMSEELSVRLRTWAITKPDENLPSLFEQIYHIQQNAAFTRTLLLKSISVQIACLVAMSITDKKPKAQKQGTDYFHAFENLLTSHVKERWKVADYAKELSISPTHLSRISREHTGHSASHLIEAAVLREACRELAYTRKRIETIAFELGFQDPAYFSRAFRRKFNLSPTEYRKSVNNASETDELS